ncbi:hypothetical protein [Streptomyces xantholiticus]|uniref:Uncharacterized protein n=1 Tax=Streptomyces xantholiticus TaxID=68285 RepID=A0ABV1UZZ6_9ACTN
MTTATPHPNAVAAATRAEALATLARRRAPLHPAQSALLEIAARLDTVAQAFTTEVDVINGITISNSVPGDAWLALHEAETIAEEAPATGFPAEFGQYVTQPVYGHSLDVPDPVNPSSVALAAQEARLIAALVMVHHELADTAADAAYTAAMLDAAFLIRSRLARVAAAARIDNARTCNRR